MEILLSHLLFFLSVILLLFGIICLWKLFWSATSLSDKDVDKESPKQPMVSQEQIESARQALASKSKPLRCKMYKPLMKGPQKTPCPPHWKWKMKW